MTSSARCPRIAAVIGAVLLASALSGCDQSGPPREPAAPAPSVRLSDAGADGLTVRYLDADGKIKSLDVEDFPQ